MEKEAARALESHSQGDRGVSSNDSGPDALGILHHLPVAVIVAENRKITHCNDRALDMFRTTPERIIGASFAELYPAQKDFLNAAEHFAPLLSRHEHFNDDRIMRRMDGTHFWVTVRGYGFNEADPYQHAAWVFTDSVQAQAPHSRVTLTPRERDVAALLVDGQTSKEAAKTLGISPRTVDIHRCSLLKKYSVNSTAELIARLVK